MSSAAPTHAWLSPPGNRSHGPPAHRPPGPLAPPPGTALCGRPAAHITLRAPSHASPSAARRPRGRRDAETPRRRARASTGPADCPPRSLARSLALYSFSHCLPCQNTTLVTCPNNSQPILVTSSAEAARAGCYGNASRAPWSWRLGTGLPGQGSQRIQGPAGAACTARLSSHGTALRVHWGHLGDVNLGLTLDGKIIIVSTPPQGCWPGAKELGIQP